MKKGRFTVIIAAALVLTVVCGVLFAACDNDPPSVGSMGVEDFGNVFTNDLDTTAAENLAASAQITAIPRRHGRRKAPPDSISRSRFPRLRRSTP